MRTIPGMTNDEVFNIIDKVCKRSMHKYKIDGLTPEDLYQESFLICNDALDRYEDGKPLENFLAFNLSRRIKTLYRNVNIKKIDFVSIDDVPSELLWDIEKPEEVKDFVNIINDKLSVDMRHDYIKYIHGVDIPRIRKQKLIKKLKELANEFWS